LTAAVEGRTIGSMSSDPRMAEAVEQIVTRIVRRFDPERVILFGSHARGNAAPDSDVDLLVVMDVEGSRRRKAVEIGVAVHDIRVAKDIVVTTPSGFAARRSVAGTIERQAVKEGRVVYERL